MADLDAESLTQTRARPGDPATQRDQAPADCTCGPPPRHAFEELPPVENADAVEEHDQAGQADRTDDLGLRRKCADGQADEQNGADAERKSADIDLADQVTEADGEERRKNRLGADDVAGKVEHGKLPSEMDELACRCRISGRGSRGAELFDDALDQVRRCGVACRRACIRGSSPSI